MDTDDDMKDGDDVDVDEHNAMIPERRIALKHGGSLLIKSTPTRFPFGRRGIRLLSWSVPYEQAKHIKYVGVPGVSVNGSIIECTWDAAPVVAGLLGEDCPPIPWADPPIPLPGRERYLRLGLDKILRPYQKEAALFLARRAYGWNSDPMRVGKTPESLAASVLIDAQKILVVPPAFVTREWAKQIAKFIDEEALVLEGRAKRSAYIFCKTCSGTGRLKDPTSASTDLSLKCHSCIRRGRAIGKRLIHVEDLRPVYQEMADVDGISYSPWPATTWSCPKHPLVTAAAQGLCPACQDDLDDAITAARYIIVNPELLMAHRDSDDNGAGFYRMDLQGWASYLARYKFDLCIRDEAHQDRGYPLGDKEKTGVTRRDRLKEVVQHIEYVWMVTGTPSFGFTRDYWSQLDIMSKGLWSADWCLDLPFSFGKRYCQAHKNLYNGYDWNGRSPEAETELEPRLRVLKIARPRSVILPFMPRKTRQIIEIDAMNAESKPIRLSKKDRADKHTKESALSKMMARAGDVTRPVMIENVMTEIAEGNKVIVFAKLHDSVDKIAKAFDKSAGNREYKVRWKQTNASVWACHGGQSKEARQKMAEAFQHHRGAGIFIASIDAFQVGVSLASRDTDHMVTSVHFTEFHHSPRAMAQAEDRPYEPGSTGLTIFYYIARGTIHDRMLRLLIPRIETADVMEHDEEAKTMLSTLQKEEAENLDDILDRLTANADDEIEIGEDD